jgi:hypothetical protein
MFAIGGGIGETFGKRLRSAAGRPRVIDIRFGRLGRLVPRAEIDTEPSIVDGGARSLSAVLASGRVLPCSAVSLIRIALIGLAVPLVRDAVALIGLAVPLVRIAVSLIGLAVPLILIAVSPRRRVPHSRNSTTTARRGDEQSDLRISRMSRLGIVHPNNC